MKNNKLLRSIGYALNGWKRAMDERNIKIHLGVAYVVILMGSFFNISTTEWLVIILMIGGVLSAELFNTVIEEICNLLTKKLKLTYEDTTIPRDVAAGAVLILALMSVVGGVIIFMPKLLMLVK